MEFNEALRVVKDWTDGLGQSSSKAYNIAREVHFSFGKEGVSPQVGGLIDGTGFLMPGGVCDSLEAAVIRVAVLIREVERYYRGSTV